MNSSMYEKSNVPQDRNSEHLLNNEQLSCSVDLLFCFLYNSSNRHPITKRRLSIHLRVHQLLLTSCGRRMDHMRSHHAKVVKELLDERKVAYLYLPPYSPDLNPIEKLWSKLKPVLRTLKVRAFEMLPSAVAQAFRSISTEDCKGVVSLMRFMR